VGRGLSQQQRRVLALGRQDADRHVTSQQARAELYGSGRHGRTAEDLRATHTATSRTLVRLCARGLLERRARGSYRLTAEGLAIADRLTTD